MGNLDDDKWAAAHYRVERESTGVKTSPRKLKKIAEHAAKHGDPVPVQSHDIIRIFDRAGRVVFERDWGQNRDAAVQEEARIVDDLLKMDLMTFRARYTIQEPEESPAEDGAEGNEQGTSG